MNTHPRIHTIHMREVIDSRGNPTLEVEVTRILGATVLAGYRQ